MAILNSQVYQPLAMAMVDHHGLNHTQHKLLPIQIRLSACAELMNVALCSPSLALAAGRPWLSVWLCLTEFGHGGQRHSHILPRLVLTLGKCS